MSRTFYNITGCLNSEQSYIDDLSGYELRIIILVEVQSIGLDHVKRLNISKKYNIS